MERKKLLILPVIGGIIVLMGIGTLLIVSSMVNTSTFLSNPPINTATEKYLSFDNCYFMPFPKN